MLTKASYLLPLSELGVDAYPCEVCLRFAMGVILWFIALGAVCQVLVLELQVWIKANWTVAVEEVTMFGSTRGYALDMTATHVAHNQAGFFICREFMTLGECPVHDCEVRFDDDCFGPVFLSGLE